METLKRRVGGFKSIHKTGAREAMVIARQRMGTCPHEAGAFGSVTTVAG